METLGGSDDATDPQGVEVQPEAQTEDPADRPIGRMILIINGRYIDPETRERAKILREAGVEVILPVHN